MLPFEAFEEYAKKRLKDLLEKGEKPTIISGFIDFFGDASIVACSKCGVPVFCRPWILEAITEHNLKVACICCADPQDFKGQVAMSELEDVEIDNSQGNRPKLDKFVMAE